MFLMTFGTTLRRTEAGLHELGGGDVVGGRFVALAAGGNAPVNEHLLVTAAAAAARGELVGWKERSGAPHPVTRHKRRHAAAGALQWNAAIGNEQPGNQHEQCQEPGG